MKKNLIKAVLIFVIFSAGTLFSQDETKIKEGIKTVYENIFSTGDFSEVEKYIDANIVDHTPDNGQTPGLEGLKGAFKLFRTGFPDLKFKIIEVIFSGNKAAIHSNITGTNSGEFMGMPATNKKIDYNQVDIVYFSKDNKATERWGYFDVMKMMSQLGVK
jgi:predicted ester cyclase